MMSFGFRASRDLQVEIVSQGWLPNMPVGRTLSIGAVCCCGRARLPPSRSGSSSACRRWAEPRPLEYQPRFARWGCQLLATLSCASGLDVLVYPEEVPGVILLLDRRETFVVVAISGLNPILALFHHEIHVGSTRRVRMESAPVISRPFRDDLLV